MKKKLSFLAVILAVLSIVYACSRTEVIDDEQKPAPAERKKTQFTKSAAKADTTKVLFRAIWSEFGRTSRNCDGWGLCNLQSCWFCCWSNDVIVDCPSNQRFANAGTVELDKVTGEGTLTIELVPWDESHVEAIRSQPVMFIDEDIITEDFVVYAGEYLYNKTVGEYGGYIMRATAK
jgi:hypothetical protein